MAYSNRFRRSHENAKTTFGSTIASLTRHALYDVKALFFVQKYKSWIVCPANSWQASRGGARQVHE